MDSGLGGQKAVKNYSKPYGLGSEEFGVILSGDRVRQGKVRQ